MWEQIKSTFQRNKLQKFIALISATLLWFFVMDTQNPVINGSYEVPLTMSNTPRGFKPIFQEQTIKIELSAPRSYFIDYGANNMRAFANLQNYSAEGEYEIPVEASFPKGFELESITPSTVQIQLDPFIEKQVIPSVTLTGSPAPYSIVKEQIKSSETVTLIGAKNSVNRVKRVIGYIGLNGNGETFDISVPMTAVDDNGREVSGVRVAPSSITVTVRIENERVKKTVPVNVDVTIPAGREISELIISPETVEIFGREEFVSEVESINTESLNFFVNAKTFIGKLKLIVPEGVTTSQDEVDVTCKFKE